jgi:hypothetical protein
MAVLISVTPNRADGIGQLSCVLALCNDPVLADLAREYGFPVVEADLVYDSGRLQAKVGLFADGSTRDPEGIREALLITFAGITDFNEHKGEQLPWPSYMQRASSPDPDRCAAELRVIDSGWPTVPAKVERVPKTKAMRLTFERVRFPNLSFLLHAEAMPKSVMSRLVDLPPPPQAPPKASARIPQATVFGPAFRFKNVEIIGFRIDASRIGPDANVGILLERFAQSPRRHNAAGRQLRVPVGDAHDYRRAAALRRDAIDPSAVADSCTRLHVPARAADTGAGRPRRRRHQPGARAGRFRSNHIRRQPVDQGGGT